MKPVLHILGTPPEHWEEALSELREDLGIELGEAGIDVTCVPGDELAVESDGKSVTLTWAAPIQFYRAVSLIPLPLTACSIREKARFQSSGIASTTVGLRGSRVAVSTPAGLLSMM